jgi:hypothetical protein
MGINRQKATFYKKNKIKKSLKNSVKNSKKEALREDY